MTSSGESFKECHPRCMLKIALNHATASQPITRRLPESVGQSNTGYHGVTCLMAASMVWFFQVFLSDQPSLQIVLQTVCPIKVDKTAVIWRWIIILQYAVSGNYGDELILDRYCCNCRKKCLAKCNACDAIIFDCEFSADIPNCFLSFIIQFKLGSKQFAVK